MDKQDLIPLTTFLSQIPGLTVASFDVESSNFWWIKFSIDTESRFAWNVVQELGFVLNYLSVEERLPTIFMPVSPPPYLNGGPKEFLSWVIETTMSNVNPADIARILEDRLPKPVDDLSQWGDEQE